jgi:hypothetical protein
MAGNDIEKHGGKLGFFSAWLLGIVFLVQLVFMGNSFGIQDGPQPTSEPDSGARADIEEHFGKLPLYFIENRGQVDSRVAYYVKGRDKTLFFTSEGLTLVLNGKDEVSSSNETGFRRVSYSSGGDQSGKVSSMRRWVVKLDFVGANSDVRPVGVEPTEAVFSYFKGPRDQWKTGLKTYASVIYRDLWPGIDLVYTGTVNRLKYRFVVRPGADPEVIRLAYRGATSVVVTDGGQLGVNTPVGGFNDDRPYSYQEVKGQRVEVATGYRLQGGSTKEASIYGFKVDPYDRSIPLIIDPAVLVYCGYIGGSGYDTIRGIAVDDDGNAYITGITSSTETNFPVTVGPDLTYNGEDYDAFVAKVNATGTALDYCGYIGGSNYDLGRGIAVDDDGSAYITGSTRSTESTFPVTVGPDLTYNGSQDAFIAKVNVSGTALDYCGYIGGSWGDSGYGIAVDVDGNAYVTGETSSNEANFPVTVGPDLTYDGSLDAFVAKVNASGTALDYCGYIGGSGNEDGGRIAVDDAGNAYITGTTRSTEDSFPVTVGPDLTYNGSEDAFIAKVNVSGTAFDYCGYIGGDSRDYGCGIAVDDDGSAYVTGWTFSTESTFPVTVGPDLTYNGSQDAFIAKVNVSGTALDYCGYIGGSSSDSGWGIAVDGDGNAYITGGTSSTEANFPVTVGPDLIYNGGHDVFIAKVNASGTALDYCGYIGGSNYDLGRGIAVDDDGSAYITGSTRSTESTFPVTVGPDLTYNGSQDAFIAKVVEPSIWYVDGDVPTSGNGTSWEEAFKTIQEAIDATDVDDEIWVKKGAYYLDSTIEANKPVAMYAGFDGTENQRDQREWQNNVTIVNGQDTVQCFWVTADATIDGFTIAHGYTAWGGGGMYNDNCSPLVANCTFLDNYAGANGGGGMHNWNGSPTVTNCIFSGNNSDSNGGGGMLNMSCPSPKITSCIFSENEAIWGGGLHNHSSSPTITNCIFDRNSATDGGGIHNRESSSTMTNCTFSGNNADSGGGIFNYLESSPTIINCILWGNTAINGSQIYNYSSSYLTITYCDIDQDGYAGSNGNIRQAPRFMDLANGDIHLQQGSPCVDVGNNATPQLPDTDFEGDPRVLDGDNDGTATVDMGADEYLHLPTVVLGLGTPGGQGFMEVVEANPPYAHLDWLRVPWPDYNAAVGGTHPCLCNLDDDPYPELVVGLDSYPTTGGYVEIRDDATTGYAHLTWIRVPWPAYNAVNGATYPTCGDFDGDGKNELAIGLGTCPTTGGYVEIRDDAIMGFAHMAWVRVPWPAYNSANGATLPAAGDFDGDGKDELAIGLGTYTATGGYVEIRDDATTGFVHMAWPRVPWPAYNSANGATHPTCGDLDGDGRAELAIGLGGYPARGGYVEIKDDSNADFTHLAWPRVPWPAYNAANGATYPACGNLDGDEVYELAIGLGTYTTKGGYVEIKDDYSTGYAHIGWPRVHWPAYNSANGETRPGLGR